MNRNLCSNCCPPVETLLWEAGLQSKWELVLNQDPRIQHFLASNTFLCCSLQKCFRTLKSLSSPRALFGCSPDPAQCHFHVFRCGILHPKHRSTFQTSLVLRPQLYKKVTQRTHKKAAGTCGFTLKCGRSMRIRGCFLVSQSWLTPQNFTGKCSLQSEPPGLN